ncbi:MAG TPA: bifunctional riboflavin kinase/FAD synthetase [Bryobacteraceae bacterium]|nr:bifunctional riboflavin kinase/FAD synthetase [Bryobacteraceae bacterium]
MSTEAPRVYRSLEEIRGDAKPSAVTIGNFDGVHAGHRKLMQRVVTLGREHGWTPTVLTFDPHPTRIVAPARAPRLLSTPEQRVTWMAQAGIEQVLLLPFSRSFSQLTPEDFVRSVLVERLHAKAAVVGENFRFGKNQAGDTRVLADLGTRYGFCTEVVHPVSLRGRTVSSSAVRGLVESGLVSAACRLLGRPYWIEGTVVRGHGVGSRQTVPTLNLSTAAEVLPASGVYVTRTYDLESGRKWRSITNVGYRPTFDGQDLTVETYVLEPLRDPAPTRIRVEFIRRVRDERRFESAEALKQQILRDVQRAHSFFRRFDRWVKSR